MAVCNNPTLIERIVNVFPGSHFVKCLIFSSICGVPFLLLTRFMDTLNVQDALTVFGPLLWQNIVTFSFANFVLLLYSSYGVRYMRTKVVSMMPRFETIVGEDSCTTLHMIFKSLCSIKSAIIISLLLIAVSLASFPDQFSQHSAGPISLAQMTLSFPFVYLSYGTFIWSYSSSVKCLYSLGKKNLKLTEFDEDMHLGAKPFGSLSLSLALVYFIGLGLVFFSFLAIPPPLELALGVMILGGIVLFFLPLLAVHRSMQNKKRLERERFKTRFAPLISSMYTSMQNPGRINTQDLKRILTIGIIDRYIGSIAEWPFDTRTLSLLSAIVLTVVAGTLTRYITLLLG